MTAAIVIMLIVLFAPRILWRLLTLAWYMVLGGLLLIVGSFVVVLLSHPV
jgi:hypothetical protein